MRHKHRNIGRPVPTLVGLKGAGDWRRTEAEQFVHACFMRAYGADVRHYLPILMGLRDADGHLQGVLGLGEAISGAMFLEQYLERPAEQILEGLCGAPVDRGGVTEVGNLAVANPGGGRWLILALTAYLHGIGQEWVVFTCGPSLRNAFLRLGLGLLDLGEADPARLPPGEATCWGKYYLQRPRVKAIRVAAAYQVMSNLLEVEQDLRALWQGASRAARGRR